MKRAFIALVAASAFAAYAEPTGNGESFETQTARRARETPLVRTEQNPNQITAGHLTYSGIAVEITKTDNPLHLINPAAPLRYGSSEDNLVREPVDGKISGLKFFSISF